MTIQDYIAELQNPNNTMTNALRSGVNASVASGSQNLNNLGAGQGWGGRSGLLAKVQGQNQGAGTQAIATGIGDLEKTRVGQLGNAVQFQDQEALQREQMAQQLNMFMQQMAMQQQQLDAANEFDWGSVLQSLFGAAGSIGGGLLGGGGK